MVWFHGCVSKVHLFKFIFSIFFLSCRFCCLLRPALMQQFVAQPWSSKCTGSAAVGLKQRTVNERRPLSVCIQPQSIYQCSEKPELSDRRTNSLLFACSPGDGVGVAHLLYAELEQQWQTVHSFSFAAFGVSLNHSNPGLTDPHIHSHCLSSGYRHHCSISFL